MALQNFQYDIIMREYNRRQSQVQHDLEERRAEAFARMPRLLEIDSEVAALSAQKARSLLQGEPGSVDDLKKDVADKTENIDSLSGSTITSKSVNNGINAAVVTAKTVYSTPGLKTVGGVPIG